MYESIVVGTDGSETSKRAVAEATRLGEAMGSTVHVVSAYEPLRGTKIVGAPEGAAKVWSVKPDAQVESIVAAGRGRHPHAQRGGQVVHRDRRSRRRVA